MTKLKSTYFIIILNSTAVLCEKDGRRKKTILCTKLCKERICIKNIKAYLFPAIISNMFNMSFAGTDLPPLTFKQYRNNPNISLHWLRSLFHKKYGMFTNNHVLS